MHPPTYTKKNPLLGVSQPSLHHPPPPPPRGKKKNPPNVTIIPAHLPIPKLKYIKPPFDMSLIA